MRNRAWLLSVMLLSLTVFLLKLRSPSMEVICSQENAEHGARSENPFQIHVLTWNRPASVKRLLDSLSISAYDGHVVDLIIHIDGGRGTEETEQISVDFEWPHGRKEKIN